MWWEAPKSMIQEHFGVVLDADKVDVDVLKWEKDDLGAVEE